MEHYNALWDELLDSNGRQVDLVDLVMTINSEFTPLNTKDLPGQSTLEDMCWQGGESTSLVSSASYTYIDLQYKPVLVENVIKDYRSKIDLINDLRGIMTLNEAGLKFWGGNL